MNLHSPLLSPIRPVWARSAILSIVAALGVHQLDAQVSYTAVDLTPTASGSAQTASGGQAAGFTGSVPNAFTGRATLWTGDGPIDLHPAFLDGAGARSQVNGFAGNLQVGTGAGAATGNRNVPLAWSDSAASATLLTIPFTNSGGQANATDGLQIVGSAIGLNNDGTAIGSTHGLIWNVANGSAVDVGADSNIFDVAAGMQVGFITKTQANAVFWRGTNRATSLHPKGAVVSVANGTDGVRQVGYAGFDIRVRVEAAKGNKNKRFTYAYVWTGTAASGLNIHPYVSNADGALLEFSYALKVKGPYIVGYATVPAKIGTPAYNRAIVWDASFQAIDLNAYLPEGFIGSTAYGVDESGNIAGVMTNADGTRHAVLWMPNP
ncbi:MAG: hypothetical protein JNN17_14045 [Verrucomicrobiaceae bacterium]|nr:hypothetical protein [Verrucomicrobiaceae bacterium]